MLFLPSLQKLNQRTFTSTYGRYSQDCENILLMGDYNVEITETNKSSFCEIYHLIDITKQPSCFKSPSNSSFIDIFLLTMQTVSKNLQLLKPVFLISISFLSETATRGVLWRKMFLEISQDSQENNYFFESLKQTCPNKTKRLTDKPLTFSY